MVNFNSLGDLMKAISSGELDELAAAHGGVLIGSIGPIKGSKSEPENACCNQAQAEAIPYNDELTEMPTPDLFGNLLANLGVAISASRRGAEGLALSMLSEKLADIYDEMITRMAVEADAQGTL